MSSFPLHFPQIPKSAMAPKALPNSLISTLPLSNFFTPSPPFWPKIPPPWGPWTPLLLLCKLSIHSHSRYLPTDAWFLKPPGCPIWKSKSCHSLLLQTVFITYTGICVHAKSLQSCPTLCNPIDCSPPSQAHLSVGFSSQEYYSGLPCPPPGDLPGPGIKPASLMSSALAGRFFTTSATWEAPYRDLTSCIYFHCLNTSLTRM